MNAARTGRKPAGPQIAERLEGSPVAKQRLEVILETIAGRLTVPEACQQEGRRDYRIHTLSSQTRHSTLDALDAGPLGRGRLPAALRP